MKAMRWIKKGWMRWIKTEEGSEIKKKNSEKEQWESLQRTDQNVSFNIKNCMPNIIQFSGIVRNHGITAIKNVTLAGSACEGTVLSRVFLVEEGHSEKSNVELEFDLEFILIELPKILKERVEKTEMTGFVRLSLTLDEAFGLSLKNGWKFPGEYKQIYSYIIQSGCINTSEFKKAMKQLFIYRHDGKFLDAVIAFCFNKNVNDVEVECVYPGVLTKSSIMTTIIIKIKGEAVLKVSYDAVALIKLAWWPDAAQEWLTRHRNWPCKEDIAVLGSHCFIIPKPLTLHQTESDITESNARNAMNFRYTFSHIERELMSMFSEQQKLVYFLFKSIFYKHIKTLKLDVIQSYCCKTVMLWTCEKFDPGSPFWDENWKSTIQAVVYLFKELLGAFQRGSLQHYFIQQINVIDNIPKGLQNAITQKIVTIIADIYDFIPQNLSNIYEFGSLLNNVFMTMKQGSDILAKERNIWWSILRRPLFTVNLIYCFTFHTYYRYYMHLLILIIGILVGLVFICVYHIFNLIHL